MRVTHVQFKIRRLMMVVAAAALALTPFAWSAPESRGLLLLTGLTVVTMLMILTEPFSDRSLRGGPDATQTSHKTDEAPSPSVATLHLAGTASQKITPRL